MDSLIISAGLGLSFILFFLKKQNCYDKPNFRIYASIFEGFHLKMSDHVISFQNKTVLGYIQFWRNILLGFQINFSAAAFLTFGTFSLSTSRKLVSFRTLQTICSLRFNFSCV